MHAGEGKGGQFQVPFCPFRKHWTWAGSWAAFNALQPSAPSAEHWAPVTPISPHQKVSNVSPRLTALSGWLADCKKQRNKALTEAEAVDRTIRLSHCKHPLHRESQGLDTPCCFSD